MASSNLIHLLRHGQYVTGQENGDGVLTAVGRRQARRTAARLADCRIAKLHSSDVQRARETAVQLTFLHSNWLRPTGYDSSPFHASPPERSVFQPMRLVVPARSRRFVRSVENTARNLLQRQTAEVNQIDEAQSC